MQITRCHTFILVGSGNPEQRGNYRVILAGGVVSSLQLPGTRNQHQGPGETTTHHRETDICETWKDSRRK